jgi:hypothetical protein
VELENPSACATVNCKWWFKRVSVTEVLINPIIRTRTSHFRHAYQPTRNSIFKYLCSKFMHDILGVNIFYSLFYTKYFTAL